MCTIQHQVQFVDTFTRLLASLFNNSTPERCSLRLKQALVATKKTKGPAVLGWSQICPPTNTIWYSGNWIAYHLWFCNYALLFFFVFSFFFWGGGQYVVGAGTETFYTTDAVELGGWVQIAFGRWQWGRLFNNQLPTIRSRSLFNTILTLTSSHQKVTFVQLDQLLIQSG